MGKEIIYSNHSRCNEAAAKMNPNHIRISNNQTRGSSYYEWIFSDDAVYLVSNSGQGKAGGRFTDFWLIKGTAHKVGRDQDNLELFNERITV